MNPRKGSDGFTLIELIIIIIILGLLAAVAIPKYLDMRQVSMNASAKGVLANLRTANSLLWCNRIINNHTTTYGFTDLVGNMEMKGGITWAVASSTELNLTVGASAYSFTLSAIATPPTTYPPVETAEGGVTPAAAGAIGAAAGLVVGVAGAVAVRQLTKGTE